MALNKTQLKLWVLNLNIIWKECWKLHKRKWPSTLLLFLVWVSLVSWFWGCFLLLLGFFLPCFSVFDISVCLLNYLSYVHVMMFARHDLHKVVVTYIHKYMNIKQYLPLLWLRPSVMEWELWDREINQKNSCLETFSVV